MPFRGLFGYLLGASWRHFGTSEGSLDRPGGLLVVLNASGEPLGAAWGRLGPSWGPLGGLLGLSWGHVGAILAPLGASWAPLGAILGRSWEPSERSWSHLGGDR